MINSRECNSLWWNNPSELTVEDLKILTQAFKVGFIPLGDLYGEHNPKRVKWKQEVENEIKFRLTNIELDDILIHKERGE